MMFKITFKKGLIEVASVPGIKKVDTKDLTLEELQRVVQVEALLEKVLGLRVHITEC